LISAALRHVRDAELLADSTRLSSDASPDQAYHLAGYAPECARKACLSARWADKAIGHGVSTSERSLELVLSLDRHAHRYRLRGWATAHPDIAAWRPDVRYDATGTHVGKTAGLVAAARHVVDTLVLALWTDGRLDREELR
jgi:hypothetical protein